MRIFLKPICVCCGHAVTFNGEGVGEDDDPVFAARVLSKTAWCSDRECPRKGKAFIVPAWEVEEPAVDAIANSRPTEWVGDGADILKVEVAGNHVSIFLKNGGFVLGSAVKDGQLINLRVEVFEHGLQG